MDSTLSANCSELCQASQCHIDPWLNSQDGMELLFRLCSLSSSSTEVQRMPLSLVLCAVMWTLLSCGILLALFFLGFTLRFLNNRIVRMSSPILNILTLCGSILTYSSGLMFAINAGSAWQPSISPRTLLQARIWTLCIGSSLVFGAMLGKAWRLYRIYTALQRVIIKDVQLIGFVLLLILVDVLFLTIWILTDPLECAQSISAVMKVGEHGVFYSLSLQESCSSQYSDVWIFLLSVIKGGLLLFGAYLAGQTCGVSCPPVNQSLNIMMTVSLVALSIAASIPISGLLHTWPNVVCALIPGAILVCTLTMNCLMFVPQLTRYKQSEDKRDANSSQMANLFSRTKQTLFEDELCFLKRENSSMKSLLAEKSAEIERYEELVTNFKEKLLERVSPGSSAQDKETGRGTDRGTDRRTDSSFTSPDSFSMQSELLSPLPETHKSHKSPLTLPRAPYPPGPSLTAMRDLRSTWAKASGPLGGQRSNYSKELQEVILELGMDSSNVPLQSPSTLLTDHDKPLSYPGISPCAMRKGRPPLWAFRGGPFAFYCPLSPFLAQNMNVTPSVQRNIQVSDTRRLPTQRDGFHGELRPDKTSNNTIGFQHL